MLSTREYFTYEKQKYYPGKICYLICHILGDEFVQNMPALLQHIMGDDANITNIESLARALFVAHLNGELQHSINGILGTGDIS